MEDCCGSRDCMDRDFLRKSVDLEFDGSCLHRVLIFDGRLILFVELVSCLVGLRARC